MAAPDCVADALAVASKPRPVGPQQHSERGRITTTEPTSLPLPFPTPEQFVQEGVGHIRMTASFDDETNLLKVTVEDNGRGLSAEGMGKIFKVWTQAEGTGVKPCAPTVEIRSSGSEECILLQAGIADGAAACRWV